MGKTDKKAQSKSNGDSKKTKVKAPPVQVKASKPVKKHQSSDEESSEESSESESEKPKVNGKAAPVISKATKTDSASDDSSDDSADDSSSEDEKPVKKANGKASKEQSSSSDESSEDEKPKAQSKPKNAGNADSDDSSEGSDSSDDEAPKTATPAKVKQAKSLAAKKSSTSKQINEKQSKASSDESSSDASSDESEPDVKSKDAKTTDATASLKNGKRKADQAVEAPTKKVKLDNGDAAPSNDSSEESKTCFIGRLSWNVDNDWLATEFADCGEVVSARVQMDRNTGKSRGFGFVEFATAEGANAAVALNGTKEIDGRAINIDKTTPKPANPEKRAKAFGDVPSEPSTVLFVGNVSFDTTEDGLWEVFAEYGEVKSVRLPTDRETQRPKGFGYVEFVDIDSAKKAFEGAKGLDIGGRPLRLDFSQPRTEGGGGDRGGPRRGRGGFGGDRGGGDRGWGGRGGFGGGDRGGRGGRDGGRGGGRGGRGGRGGAGAGRGGARTGGAVEFKGSRMTF